MNIDVGRGDEYKESNRNPKSNEKRGPTALLIWLCSLRESSN